MAVVGDVSGSCACDLTPKNPDGYIVVSPKEWNFNSFAFTAVAPADLKHLPFSDGWSVMAYGIFDLEEALL